MKTVLTDNAIEFLQSLAILSVQAQELLRQGRFSTVADLLYDIRSDLDRAENIVSTLEID